MKEFHPSCWAYFLCTVSRLQMTAMAQIQRSWNINEGWFICSYIWNTSCPFQGLWCCYCPDLHPQHAHSLRRPSALWVCHFCEDTTRSGGGKGALTSVFQHLRLDNGLCTLIISPPPITEQKCYLLCRYTVCKIFTRREKERRESDVRWMFKWRKYEPSCIDPIYYSWEDNLAPLSYVTHFVWW